MPETPRTHSSPKGSNRETAADDTPLTALFGTHAKVELLAVFVSERGRDLNVSDLARLAGLARSTVYEHLDDLRALGVVEETRTVGNGSMFALVEDDPISRRVLELEGLILDRQLDPEARLERSTD